MMTKRLLFKILLPVLAVFFGLSTFLHAEEEAKLPIPRFVSVRASKAYVRVGPRADYPVKWIYHRQGIPVEIIQEFDTWRKVRDVDGEEGWIASTLLDGKRTMIVAPWNKDKSQTISLHNDPSNASHIIAYLEPGVLGKIINCNGKWCRVNINGKRGWLEQTSIWGVYPDEVFNK